MSNLYDSTVIASLVSNDYEAGRPASVTGWLVTIALGAFVIGLMLGLGKVRDIFFPWMNGCATRQKWEGDGRCSHWPAELFKGQYWCLWCIGDEIRESQSFCTGN